MCGIAGIVAKTGNVDAAHLADLGQRLAHRGPDGTGIWLSNDQGTGFIHRRLAIIDPHPRSDQPMRSQDGSITVTYNGELYNHRELRVQLERSGRRFRTTSDTEVLVESLAAWGVAAIPRLRGMFAFAAHDSRSGEVLLVRDSLGIKPLYHAVTRSGDIVFASEVRAIRPLVSSEVDQTAAIDLLLWGSIAAPLTSLRGVRSLPAGTLLRIRDGHATHQRWASGFHWSDAAEGLGDEGPLIEAVRESVRTHLVADVPVAVFLSSGIDSSVIASIAATVGGVSALTIRDPDSDESAEAATMARTFGMDHQIVEVPEGDAKVLVEGALDAMDQPSVDGVNSFIIARAAADAGFRVALSGVGGDELFGGYPTFSRIPSLSAVHRALSPFGRLPAEMLRHPPSVGWNRHHALGRARWIGGLAGLPNGSYLVARGVFSPAEVAHLLDANHTEVLDVAEERLASIPVSESMRSYATAAELNQYLQHQLLRDIDATTMASSVEVRTPLVDIRLHEVASSCPHMVRTRGPAKAVLRASAKHSIKPPTTPKKGFSVPMARWIREGEIRLDAVDQVVGGSSAHRILEGVRTGRTHWSRAWLLQVLGREWTRRS